MNEDIPHLTQEQLDRINDYIPCSRCGGRGKVPRWKEDYSGYWYLGILIGICVVLKLFHVL